MSDPKNPAPDAVNESPDPENKGAERPDLQPDATQIPGEGGRPERDGTDEEAGEGDDEEEESEPPDETTHPGTITEGSEESADWLGAAIALGDLVTYIDSYNDTRDARVRRIDFDEHGTPLLTLEIALPNSNEGRFVGKVPPSRDKGGNPAYQTRTWTPHNADFEQAADAKKS